MKVLVETSALIGASVYWESDGNVIKDVHFDKCDSLFVCLKSAPDMGIITKTVENEAKSVLESAVIRTIRQTYFFDIRTKIKIMTLQHVISNDCFDRLETLIEECSTRLPVNIAERDKIQENEIEPFLKELVTYTVRYVQPHLPNFIKGQDAREELTDAIVKFLPAKGMVYKGMPADRDLRIMSEATMFYRKYKGEEEIFVASTDNHFIPNKVQVGSYLSGYKKYLDELDSTVRDKLAKKFGFIGEDPLKIADIIRKKGKP
jgi:hypothetical protein